MVKHLHRFMIGPAIPFLCCRFLPVKGEIFCHCQTYGGEITKSMDNGMTWSYPTNEMTGAKSSIYEVKFIDDEVGFATGSDGLNPKNDRRW